MNACHETIYQAIYVQGRGELRIQLKQAMRRGRTARRPRSDGQSRHPRFREPIKNLNGIYRFADPIRDEIHRLVAKD